jgi:hypothetical protein
MALSVGEIGFPPRNFSDRLFILYPRVDIARRLLLKSTEKMQIPPFLVSSPSVKDCSTRRCGAADFGM